MNDVKLVLGDFDYAIFGITLAISSAIGIYFQLVNKKTNEEYMLAGKSMGILPVAFSLMATFFAATTLMGIPAEMYSYGTNMTFMNIGFAVGPLIGAYVFLPIFIHNEFLTTYQYLEKRFGIVIRRVLSGLFSLQTVLFTSAVLYAPALALSAVTNLSMWTSIISVGLVCTFYSTLGGMKAVIWADVFQAILMYICLVTVAVRGCILLGGINNIFQINYDGGRLLIPEISLNMKSHYTLPNILMQGLIITLANYGGGQMQTQRLMAMKNLKKAKIAILLSIPMLIIFQLLCCFCGFIIYAYFKNCDPLSGPNKLIDSSDQLLPFFITTTMSEIPGLAGLCISGIFSASLSTVSSSLNSLAAVTLEDFLRPLFPKKEFSVSVSKMISLLYGGLCICFAFTMASFGNLIRMSVLIVGIQAGPQLAIFTLAACTRATNQVGAVLGAVAGIGLAAGLSFIQTEIDPPLPLSNECPLLENSTASTTVMTMFATNTTFRENLQEEQPYKLAYMWISSIALVTTLVVGYVSSIVIAFFRGKHEEVPDKHLSPFRTWFSRKKQEVIEKPVVNQKNDTNMILSIRCDSSL